MSTPRELKHRLDKLTTKIPPAALNAAVVALLERWPWEPRDAVPVLEEHRADALALGARIVEAIAEVRALDYSEDVPGGITPEAFRAAAGALRDARPWHEVPAIEGHNAIVLEAAAHMVGGER